MCVSANKISKKDKKIQKDIDILKRFINIFCDNNHKGAKKHHAQVAGQLGNSLNDNPVSLCSDCNKLLLYAGSMLLHCPFDPKPRCKKCEVHCYRAPYRQQIKQVMKYSGLFSLKHGRIDLLGKYLF